ncbi:YdcF family protein [Kordia sp. YSTF-M3]|uniref:YdcF family protein n=1 Tax=Kordia aestuariivivens TaxID=2759037 RepID=A0ABR7QAP2_9FLAO|nr:ElyC/SanA/YdcF family protein [Kordia aestuariivivens]MBC8755615.1 YdcF family protein [Kordia aestuariivivens]
MKKWLKRIGWIFVIIILGIIACNGYVELNAKGKTFNKTAEIPSNKVGLLLGTGKYLQNGRVNLFYRYRINAAVQLYKAGKIQYILVSGDNGSKSYDEPTTFKEDLMAAGIPENKIILDYAGFRTLDSVVRSKEIFQQENITIISQQFHNERAIAIANAKGMNAVGFNAKNVGGRNGFKVKVREMLARVAMCIDLVVGKQPKFLGEKIAIK